MSEIWKSIPGFSFYEASSLGRIRRSVGGNGAVSGRVLSPGVVSGYLKVSPFINGVGKQVSVHRLVALAFHGVPDGERQVNHIDGNKRNNTPSNLEWVTASENVRHAFRTGLRVSPRAGSPGQRNGRALISEAEAAEIRSRHREGEPVADLAREFGLGHLQAWKVATGRAWKHQLGGAA